MCAACEESTGKGAFELNGEKSARDVREVLHFMPKVQARPANETFPTSREHIDLT